MPPLTDGVVCLRAWSETDAQWYVDACRDEQIQRFTSEPPTLTAAEVAHAIVRLRDDPDAHGFLIADARSGEPLGNIAISVADGVGHVSYWVAAGARGRGAATRALHLLVGWACAAPRTTELRLWTRVDNAASRAVAEKAGFVRDPDRDGQRQVKGATWQTVAYRTGCSLVRPR